jgi:hypothetical protein
VAKRIVGVENEGVGLTEEDTGLSSLPETLIALKTGIPTPVQRGFWRALIRVSPAMAEVPAAWFETKAKQIRERGEVEVAALRAEALIERESATCINRAPLTRSAGRSSEAWDVLVMLQTG